MSEKKIIEKEMVQSSVGPANILANLKNKNMVLTMIYKDSSDNSTANLVGRAR